MMQHSPRITRTTATWLASATLLMASLAGAAGSGAPHNPAHGYSDEARVLTELDAPFIRDGRAVPQAVIHALAAGQSAAHVRAALGEPERVTPEGNTQAWEYHLALPMGGGDSHIVCQYMVILDGTSEQVIETAWRRRQCKTLMDEWLAASQKPVTLQLSSDFLFAFDKDELSPEGHQVLNDLYAKLQNHPTSQVRIVGHTDRLGSDTYNQALSLRRAERVVAFLIERGFPRTQLSSAGAGESQPVKHCAGERATLELKACLAPNRRVSIAIN